MSQRKDIHKVLIIGSALLSLDRRVNLTIQEHRLVKHLETLGMKLY